MKKLSVITVLNTVNYGSALQTFATQKYFTDKGFEVEFVDYWRKDQKTEARIENIKKDKKDSLKKWLKKPIRDFLEIKSIKASEKVFRGFITQKINLTSQTYSSFEELKEDCPEADIYVTGSDQMWNSGWNQGIEKSFFLECVPEDKKRIAYATSIGKTEFDENEAKEIIPYIRKYDLITLREQSAVDLLKKYDIESSLVLDPTLMLGRESWEKYIPRMDNNKKYLLVYQLHNEHADASFDDAVKKIAKHKKLDIIRVTYSYSDIKVGKKLVLPDVFEFLALIKNAEFIVTDSFHGTAFSINFNKQMAVVYPKKFSTRMDNILNITGLKNRRYVNRDTVEKWDDRIDYSIVNNILEDKRKQINSVIDKWCENEINMQ